MVQEEKNIRPGTTEKLTVLGLLPLPWKPLCGEAGRAKEVVVGREERDWRQEVGRRED